MRTFEELDDFQHTIVDFAVERGIGLDDAVRQVQLSENPNNSREDFSDEFWAVLVEFWKMFAEVNS